MTILVTGARGQVGKHVLTGLLEAGATVRAASRNPQPGEFPDGVDTVRLDLTNPATLPAALTGVDKVFLYAQASTAGAFAAAAAEAGVRHVVLLSSASVVFPDAASNPIGAQHLAVEQALDDAGLGRTFVRPAYFATNALRWQSIRTDRVMRTAFPGATTSMVHERDIADVAAAALLDDARIGTAYAVLGAGTLTVRKQVAAIADALGEPVHLDQIDLDTYRTQLLTQLPAPIVDLVLATRGSVPRPQPDLATDAVQAVLGRAPRPFTRWASDHAADFR